MPETEEPGPGKAPRSRPQLSEEERKRRWRKAVMEKARQIKLMTDIAIIVMLATVIVAHLLPFVRALKIKTYDRRLQEKWDVIEQKRGYEILLGLLVPYSGDASVLEERDPYWKGRLPERPEITWGVQPRVVYTHHPGSGDFVMDRYGNPWEKRFRNVYPATWAAYLMIVVSFGTVILLALYLADFKLWMGRFLPVLSCVFAFWSVLYLTWAKVRTEGSWNALRYGSALAWHLFLVPLFLVGAFSLLRYVVSHRWKRYVWAGLEVPEHLKPAEPEEGEAKAARHGRLAAAKAGASPAKKEAGEEKPEGKKKAEEAEDAEDAGKAGPAEEGGSDEKG